MLLFAVAIQWSCSRGKDNGRVMTSGKINHISVIIDDELWNGEVGDSIRNKFASPVVGLPQEEPLFTINQYPVKLLEGFMTNTRNIIVVKKEPVSRFKIVSNEYAAPQNVIHISGKTVDEILNILEKNAPALTRLMKQSELGAYQKQIDTALINDSNIREKFGIGMKIPAGYKFALQGDKLTWLKKEIISGNMSILIYEVPIKCLEKNSNAIGNIMKMRDSVGNIYIHGTGPDTRMITEQAFAPYLFHTSIDGKKTLETRGTWELKNDFMSGPFINYAIKDKANHRILVIEGFCYAPSKPKRDLMHELEAIIKSVKFDSSFKTQHAAEMENKAL